MKKTLLFIFTMLFSLNSLYCNTLTWNDVLKEALKKNPEIANARNSLKLSDISYKSAFLNYYPDVSGSMSMRKSDSRDTSYSYGFSSKLTIFKGFKNVTEVKLKRTNLTIQEATYKRRLSDFIYDLRISFAQVLKINETLMLLDEIQNRRKNNMELVKLRYDAGREDKGAYLRSEADYLQAEYETQSENRNYKIVKAELLKNIGKDIYEEIDVTGTFNIPEINERPSKELLQMNPDYIIIKHRLEASKYELKYKYGDFYPNIGLSGSVSRSGDNWPPIDDSWGVGLSLSYPFFSGGRDFYELKSAKLNKLIAENDLENTEHELMLQIESAYNDLIDSMEYYKVREKFYAARKERSEISREKYINGLISYQDWDSIENEFINAEKSILDARYNVFASWAKWLRIIGEEE
ncbi:TolC family protein [Elusimicrobiota bacterium]